MIDLDAYWCVMKRGAVSFALAGAALFASGCASGEASSDSASNYGRPSTPVSPSGTQNPGTNVNLGGSQDTGFLRGQLEAGMVPTPAALDAAGFFAEHHIELPPPTCGARLCVQPMLAVMGNLLDGQNCTLLHVGLNSPLVADPGERPPLSLAVVVDVSGSMTGQKIPSRSASSSDTARSRQATTIRGKIA
jgi:Ca-activated chloride channel family protein